MSPKLDKSGTFADQISVHFGSPSQNVLKSDLKKSGIRPIWGQSDRRWTQIPDNLECRKMKTGVISQVRGDCDCDLTMIIECWCRTHYHTRNTTHTSHTVSCYYTPCRVTHVPCTWPSLGDDCEDSEGFPFELWSILHTSTLDLGCEIESSKQAMYGIRLPGRWIACRISTFTCSG